MSSYTTWYSQGIKCGHCKGYHTDVNQVRFCSQGLPAYSYSSPPPPPPVAPRQPVPYPAPVPQSAPARNSWFDELQVPPGRYAVENKQGELRFYIVRENNHPRFKKYRKVFVQASDNEHFIKDRFAKQSILEAILAAGIEIATLRYGLELGVCGVCGRTLTDEDSRALGIGPICREKTGWL